MSPSPAGGSMSIKSLARCWLVCLPMLGWSATVTDSAGAAKRGVALNMAVVQNKITFEANPRAARAARLNLSSKLLRLATEVQQ